MSGPSLSLNQSSAHPQSSEPQGRHAFEEGDSSRRVEVAPWVGSGDSDSLQGSGGGSVHHELENAHCLLFVSLSHSPLKGWLKGDALTSHWPAARLYIKNKKVLRWYSSPRTGWTSFGSRTGQSCWWHPWPIPVRKDLLSQMSGGVAPEPGVVEPSCVAASGISEELSALHSHVLDTLSEVRAPSTRRLYALKWGVFVK